jgi:hypothetical protein
LMMPTVDQPPPKEMMPTLKNVQIISSVCIIPRCSRVPR